MSSLSNQGLSWKQYLPFNRSPRPIPDPSKNERRLLERCSNKNLEQVSSGELGAYLLHLRSLTKKLWLGKWDSLIDQEYILHEQPFEKIVQLCYEVADVLREHGAISINKIVQKMQGKKIIRVDTDQSYDSYGLIFSILGWLSLLYIPAIQDQSGEMRIITQSTQLTIKDKIPTELVSRPLDELLRKFGELLPIRDIGRNEPVSQINAQAATPTRLEVSHMNVATLKDMANMQIIWVDSLSEHLEFDPAQPSLSLFKCPSFCRIQKQSDESTLAIMLRDFYEDYEKPSEDFTVAKLLNEVILSYVLLFRSDRRSRKVYERSERARAALYREGSHFYTDPFLDELCGNRSSSWFAFGGPIRESYDSSVDFPVFKARLERIQQHVKDIQPNRFMSLWRDQRDLRLWYTIWAVIILSIIGIVIAAISMFLAAIQVNLAKMAYELQLKGQS
ncbi:uncharacterized protein TRIVIDRAFT_69156 [Trichoderma virens Gv29-8]|uniref:Uncharacterized protein n=1 Tax=Hypocrea virens (strain Gv29-8 / FGSC 10586) TaxID=413071 RepID=G9MYL4_HYPVG|nr:uncharacterized protein TRIVIDRAFT_69156 [Trichoderma virens Gv29-8]EHK20634.1 hypothetical protein TRIVIDRAFT_69156 [Trichoderma virens Gv29-8]UKZ53094.1 hypothetical protein TrVGV298_006882 [Trichoderma virens]